MGEIFFQDFAPFNRDLLHDPVSLNIFISAAWDRLSHWKVTYHAFGITFADSNKGIILESRKMKPKSLKQREKEHIQQVLELTGWDERKASLLLKIPLSQVQRKMRENAIKKPDAKKLPTINNL